MSNSVHNRYEINNSRGGASSKIFTTEQLPPTMARGSVVKRASLGSDRQIQQRPPVASQLKSRPSLKQQGSVGYSKRMTTLQDKRKTLQKTKYINQLALLDYEEKMGEVYSKYTKTSKVSALKKIQAKNRLAQFVEEEQEEDLGFDELIQFKYGKGDGGSQKFVFEKEEINEYEFCEDCDAIHNDHPEAHYVICEKRRKEEPQLYSPYSEVYIPESLYRIKLIAQRIKSPQYQELNRQLIEVQKIRCSIDGMAQNRQRLIDSVRELKKTYYNDSVYVKIIAKVCYLIQKL